MNKLFSIDWNWRFWRLDPCSNCGENVWRRDWVFAKKTAGRPRYECFYCGQDLYPGGAVNEKLANIAEESLVGASSNARESLNTTDDGIKKGCVPHEG